MKTNYYILVDPDKPTKCKVGITKDPSQRIKAYRTAAPSCYFLKVYKNIDKTDEKKLLSLFKDIAKVESEYVHFPPELIKNIVESYFDEKY
jgi:hypothetical protein